MFYMMINFIIKLKVNRPSVEAARKEVETMEN